MAKSILLAGLICSFLIVAQATPLLVRNDASSTFDDLTTDQTNEPSEAPITDSGNVDQSTFHVPTTTTRQYRTTTAQVTRPPISIGDVWLSNSDLNIVYPLVIAVPFAFTLMITLVLCCIKMRSRKNKKNQEKKAKETEEK